ncbi:MAG: peptidoglycan-associated lipoprotein [Kiritimatiellia bacterium]|jgi:peptidoglycan-associated lipoprotein
MICKTIKTIFTISAIVLFLSACSTTTTENPDSTASKNGSTGGSSAATTSSDKSTVDTGVVAPTATVFYFDFDSSSLRADSRSLLNAHAAALQAKPRAVRLEGHADERGTREYNIALGERRAQAVRAYLLSQGVTSSIEVVSYGEERPAVQQNRRVEIK